jgi:hypothetical protein
MAFFDTFTEEEAHGAVAMMRDLGAAPWARPLLQAIADGSGLTGANKALFFELRFGHGLHASCVTPPYEIPGEAHSTLDFGFASVGKNFRVEMMRLTETTAAKAATRENVDEDGVLYVSRVLNTNADDRRQSEEGETLKAVERICQKCERNGKPYKFPPPGGAINILLVDFRTFLDGGDIPDRIHVALGGAHLRDVYRRYWKGKLIAGVFSRETMLRGAAEARERLHFIGFANEKSYRPGDFAAATQFVANPNLFANADQARAALAAWPLQPAELICS